MIRQHRMLLVLLILAGVLPLLSFAQTCGNGACEPGENSCTCSKDCGSCSGAISGEACKEYACNEQNICKITTIMNCCGNSVCEASESFGDCPGDCLPEKLDFEWLSPALDENFFRGEPVFFQVMVSAENRKILSADTKVKGFFGTLDLYNDGLHDDGNVFDAVYANRMFIEKTTGAGWHTLKLKSEFRGVSTEQDYNLYVDPMLDVVLDAQDRYFLGDQIDLNGIIKKKGHRFSLPLKIKAEKNERPVFEFDSSSDSNGFFSVSYHSSLIDPTGIWTITVSGTDLNSNEVFLQKKIEMLQPGEAAFLEVELLNELKQEYERGTLVEVIATVKDIAGNVVENASVKLAGPLKEETTLLELKPGQYSGSYVIPMGLETGEQSFTVSATKTVQNDFFAGSKEFRFSVKESVINIEVIEPSRRRYQVGENLAPRVFLSYANDEPVIDAEVKALIQNKEIELQSVEAGVFAADYFLGEEDTGRLKISFNAIDSVGNEGLSELHLEVSGTSLFYLIQQNSLIIAVVLAIVLVLGIASRSFLLKKMSKGSLSKRQRELVALEQDLQNKYFEQNAVTKEEYRELMEKYETELGDIEKKIRELEKSAGD